MMSSIELKKKLRNDIWRPADTAQVSMGSHNSFNTRLYSLPTTPLPFANGGEAVQAARLS